MIAVRVGNYASAPRLQLHGYHAAAHIPITGRTTDPQTGLRSQNWYFEAPQYIKPNKFVVIEGYYEREARDCFDVKVYLAPPESLRAEWKIKRDTLKRGYSKEQVLADLQSVNRTRSNHSSPA